MKGTSPHGSQTTLFQSLKDLLNPEDSLYKLSNKLPWDKLEKEFAPLYSKIGRPSKPVRLMVSLLLLKQIYNLGDETVVEAWVHNPYWQYFSGFTTFQWNFPIEPTDLVHFRKRIGEEGLEKIFKLSIDLHGKSSLEKEVVIDTTVQEKNITYPTDVKLHKKIIDKCVKISNSENIVLRQSYKRISKQLVIDQRGNRSSKGKAKAKKSARKLKTIAGRLIRELRRKLSEELLSKHEEDLRLFERVLTQKKGDKNKIYSLHEPKVYCMSKGKPHKRFEFGSKVSITLTKNSGVAVGALNFEENIYDGHTLPEVLEQTKRLTGKDPKVAIVDRGYRGVSTVGKTEIIRPKNPKKNATPYEKTKARKRFRRRAGIEPIIGHLKQDFRLSRNYLKGTKGDMANVLLSATAYNLKKWMNRESKKLTLLIYSKISVFFQFIEKQ
ncbi:MAG: IS5 family transposase, partial [Candidatus Njordarchaeales archaeon]